MTDSKLWDNVYEYIDNLEEPFDLVRNYRDNDGGDVPYQMCDFDDELDSYCPSDIARMVTNGDYDDGAEYFTYDSYAISTYYSVWDICDIDDVVSYVVNNDDDLGDPQLREILDAEDKDVIVSVTMLDGTQDAYTPEQFSEPEKFNHEKTLFLCGDAVMTVEQVLLYLDENDVEELELKEFTFTSYLNEHGFTETKTVCKYLGVLFGNGTCYEDGRFFKWFYCEEENLLLKVFFDRPNGDDVLFIKEMPTCGIMDLFCLINGHIN